MNELKICTKCENDEIKINLYKDKKLKFGFITIENFVGSIMFNKTS